MEQPGPGADPTESAKSGRSGAGACNGRRQARNDVGYLMMLNNRLDVAEALFREAIELSPSYYREAWQNLARLQEG